MTSDENPTRTVHEAEVRARIAEPAPLDASWLLRRKVELPDPIEGYLRRREVDKRCALTGHRVTVVHAPAGFDKTALLARRCHALRERGLAVAWLSLDEEDGPESVARLLALAFERTGVATFAPAGERGGASPLRAPEPEAGSGNPIDCYGYRTITYESLRHPFHKPSGATLISLPDPPGPRLARQRLPGPPAGPDRPGGRPRIHRSGDPAHESGAGPGGGKGEGAVNACAGCGSGP